MRGRVCKVNKGGRDRKKRAAGTLSDLGKKGAFYRSPQKLAVTAFSDRRLRPGPDIPARLRPPWVIGADRRLRSRGAGDSGQAGDSRLSPVMLRTPIQYRTTKRQLGSKKQWTEDSGSFGPETPVGPETPDHLRCTSGPQSSTAP